MPVPARPTSWDPSIRGSEDAAVRLRDLSIDDGRRCASALTDLYFSPMTERLVHGPDALRFALALAEHLLLPGERIAALERAHWRRVMPANLMLFVHADDASSAPPPSPVRDPCMTATLRTSTGRRLTIAGELARHAPVTRRMAHGRCAAEMLLPLRPRTLRGRTVLELRLPVDSAWRGRLDASSSFGLYVLLEVLGLLSAMKPAGDAATHLSVELGGLPVPTLLGSRFEAGVLLEYERLGGEAVSRAPDMLLVPYRYRFHSFQTDEGRGRLAVTTRSIDDLVARRHG